MEDWKTMEEYLVGIGADIDQNSFRTANKALDQLKSKLASMKNVAAVGALAAAIAAVGKAAYSTIKSVAQADMEYQKLAAQMWVTKETAKSLSVAMKTMGVTQEDIAWVPELREQFFRLRNEMNQFATPEDADAQLRYIREIGYDIQALQVRLKMLKEWIAYYLIRYLEPYIEDFRAFIKWLLDKVGTDMPGLARKVAGAIRTVLGPALATVKAFGMVIGKVYDFIVSLPENVKKWAAVFAAVGAAIMAGPFGAILAALSAAMLLIEDFVYYMNGWDSSETMAPIWKALLEFSKGTGAQWLEDFKNVLTEIANILDQIFNGLNIQERLEKLKGPAKFLLDSMLDFCAAFAGLVKDHEKGKVKIHSFWTALGDAIGKSLEQLGKLGTLFGFVVKMVSALMRSDWKGAESLLKSAAVYGLGALAEGLSGQLMLTPGMSGKGLVGKASEGYSLKTQGANIDDQVANLKDKWKEALPAIGGILKDAGMGDSQISSGARTVAHNATIPGASPTSWHIDHGDGGDAVDIVLPDDTTPEQANAILQYFKDSGAFHEVLFHDAGTGYHLHLGGYIPGKLEIASKTNNAQSHPKITAEQAGVSELLASLKGRRGHDGQPGMAAGFMSGSNEMVGSVFPGTFGGFKLPDYSPANRMQDLGGLGMPEMVGGGFGGGLNVGAPNVTINIGGTNASAEEIQQAVTSGVNDGMMDAIHIFTRLQRRPSI